MCGAIALAGFLVDAFGIRYDVVGNEGIFASARRHKYVALACDSSGGGSLRNTGGVSGGWRRDAASCAAVLARIQPDNPPEFAAAHVTKTSAARPRSSHRTCTLLTWPLITRCKIRVLQHDAVLKYTFKLAGAVDARSHATAIKAGIERAR